MWLGVVGGYLPQNVQAWSCGCRGSWRACGRDYFSVSQAIEINMGGDPMGGAPYLSGTAAAHAATLSDTSARIPSPARFCLEDRPGAPISFTSHDAQPKTGTTPAPPKATVNDDHPTSTGVLKRYKPFYRTGTTASRSSNDDSPASSTPSTTPMSDGPFNPSRAGTICAASAVF